MLGYLTGSKSYDVDLQVSNNENMTVKQFEQFQKLIQEAADICMEDFYNAAVQVLGENSGDNNQKDYDGFEGDCEEGDDE